MARARGKRRGFTPDPTKGLCPIGSPPRAPPLEPFILPGEQEGPTRTSQRHSRPLLFPWQWTDCKGPRPLTEVQEAEPPGGSEGGALALPHAQALSTDRAKSGRLREISRRSKENIDERHADAVAARRRARRKNEPGTRLYPREIAALQHGRSRYGPGDQCQRDHGEESESARADGRRSAPARDAGKADTDGFLQVPALAQPRICCKARSMR